MMRKTLKQFSYILLTIPRRAVVSTAFIRSSATFAATWFLIFFTMRKSKNPLIEAELKISYKTPTNPVKIIFKRDVDKFLFSIWDHSLLCVQEQLYVMYLNQASEVICWRCLHTGTITSSEIDLRLLFGFAFGCCATSIIIAHNHPTGTLVPSLADREMTKRIKEAGALLQVPLVDHFLIGLGRSFSFYREGML